MNYQDLHDTILATFARTNKLVPYISGKPGGGKSSLARSIIHHLGVAPELITEFNPSLRDPVDIMGIPNTNGDHATWKSMDEFWRLRRVEGDNRPRACIIEEMSDATMPMQNPLCRLLLDRHAGELALHENTFFIATGNNTEHKSGANRLSTKLGNRLWNLTFDENLDAWCDWALGANISVKMIQFLRFKPNLLSEFDPNRTINPTPRSWEMANCVPEELSPEIYMQSIAGCVGEGAAAEYTGFKRIFEGLPDIDGILMNPTKADVPTDPAVLYALTGALAHKSTKDNFGRVNAYVSRLPSDFQVMCVFDAQKLKPEIRQTKDFVEWAVKNSNVLM